MNLFDDSVESGGEDGYVNVVDGRDDAGIVDGILLDSDVPDEDTDRGTRCISGTIVAMHVRTTSRQVAHKSVDSTS